MAGIGSFARLSNKKINFGAKMEGRSLILPLKELEVVIMLLKNSFVRRVHLHLLRDFWGADFGRLAGKLGGFAFGGISKLEAKVRMWKHEEAAGVRREGGAYVITPRFFK